MLVAGFALMAVEPPPEPMELHQAGMTGDDKFRDVLEGNMRTNASPGSCSFGSLFGCSGLMVVLAFLSMSPSPAPRKPSVAPDFSSDEG